MRSRRGAATLSQPARTAVIVRYLGQLALMLALVMLVSLAGALWLGEARFAAATFAVAALLAAFAWRAMRTPAPERVRTNEALVIVGLAFAFSAPLLSVPFWSTGLEFEDALFEAVSAVTTTGLSTLASVEDRSPAFLFARSWIQWFGGLGIVVLSVALLMGHHAAARRLAGVESGEQFETTTRTHARRLLIVYAILTATALAALWILLGDGFEALIHALTAVATGGFSSHDASIGAFDGWPARIVIMLLALCAAIPLALYRAGWRELRREPEVQLLLLLVLIAFVLLALLPGSAAGPRREEWMLHALVLGISAQTNTGFATFPVHSLADSAKLVLVMAMFVGGSAGSTAGGIKIVRFLVLLALLRAGLLRTTLPPHAVIAPKIGDHPIGLDVIQRALIVVALFLATILFSWLAFTLAGYPALDALFEVTSATTTTGLSTGIARPELETWLKLVLMADMLLGRVEVLALLLIVYPPTWIGRRTQ